jgi:hypothetical protein
MRHIQRVEERYGQSVGGRFGSASGYAVLRRGRGRWYPIYWDGVESHDLDLRPTTLRQAERTARRAERDARKLGF